RGFGEIKGGGGGTFFCGRGGVGSSVPAEQGYGPAGGRRRFVAVWAVQRFRSQRRAACQPAAAPQGRRRLRGPTCRHDRHLGCRRARPTADAVLGRPFSKAPSYRKSFNVQVFQTRPTIARSRPGVTFPLLCHACLSFSP